MCYISSQPPKCREFFVLYKLFLETNLFILRLFSLNNPSHSISYSRKEFFFLWILFVPFLHIKVYDTQDFSVYLDGHTIVAVGKHTFVMGYVLRA